MRVADIGDGRAPGKHRRERCPPGQSVVDDRSPHARQVTTELLATVDLAGHRFAAARPSTPLPRIGHDQRPMTARDGLALKQRTAYRGDVSTRYIELTASRG